MKIHRRRVGLLRGLFVIGWLSAGEPAWPHATETIGIGARSTALAGAVTASVADPSAVYYNPAGLGYLRRSEAWLDLTSFSLIGDSDSPDTGESFDFSLDAFVLRPTVIVAGPLWWDGWSWGFGILGVSGLAGRFPADFGENRYSSISAKILQTTLTPSVAWQISERLSIGATAEISAFTKFYNELRMGDGYVGDLFALRGIHGLSTRDGTDDARVKIASDEDFQSGLRPHNSLTTDFRSASFVVGAIYRLHPGIDVGVAYKEKSEPTMRGSLAFLFEDDINGATGLPDPEVDFEADYLVRPRIVTFGVSLEPYAGYMLHVEGQWSQGSRNQGIRRELDEELLGQRELVVPLEWHDTFSPRVGLERIFPSGKRLWLGYQLDKDPASERTGFAPFPPGDLHLASIGAFFPALVDHIDVGIYFQMGILTGLDLAAGESANGGGLKRPFFDSENRIAFAPNDVAIRYHNAFLYSVGITFTVPFGEGRGT